MKKVHFKNGSSIEISNEIAEILRQRIIAGSAKFQIFNDEKNDYLLFINVEEIVYIN